MGHFMDDQEIEGHAKRRSTGKPVRRITSHEDVARNIILGRNTALVRANAEYLIREITHALQDAFDLGFRAAGGSVSAAPVLRKKK